MRMSLALLGGALMVLLPSAAFSATGCEQLRRDCMDYCRYQNPAMDHRECKRECRSRVKECHSGGRMMPGGMPGGMPGSSGQTDREPDFTGMPEVGRYGAPGAGGYPMPPAGGGRGYPGYPMGQYPQQGYPAAPPPGTPSGAAPAPAQPASPEGEASAPAPAARPPGPQYPGYGYPPAGPYGGMYQPGPTGPQGYPPYGRGY